ncbi:hypothetical protein TWF696_001515 [Orbilia brochopaga]|uniref:Protein kinase domain-containing protein n=1 Tax=Orbilia brochopaga TaxID=3140254 RepID=A0AAV9UB94_9PEZI
MRLLQFIERHAAVVCKKPLLVSKTPIGGAVTLPERPLLVGAKLRKWNHFELHLRRTLDFRNNDDPPGLQLDEAALENALAAKIKIKSDKGLRELAKLTLEEPCANVMSYITGADTPLSFQDRFNGPGIEIGYPDRILAFPHDLDGKQNRWARLPVLYKPPWEISLKNVLENFNERRFHGDESKLVKAVNQLVTYMAYNDLSVGILSNVHTTVAFRVSQIPYHKCTYQSRATETIVECSPPIHWRGEGLESPLAAYIYLALITYQNTVLGRETVELRLKTKKKLPEPLPGMKEREIDKLISHMVTPLAKKHATTIRGRIMEGETGHSIPAVFKVYDLSSKAANRAFEREQEMYEKLSNVQEKAVPKLYFANPARGVLGVMAFEDCGEPLTEWTPENIGHARRALENVHKHDVLHRDVGMHSFVVNPDSRYPVRLVGFGGAKARGLEGPEVLLDEMGDFMRLISAQPGSS